MSFVTMAIVGGSVAVAAGGAKAISGASQVKKGKRALARAVDPGYEIPKEFERNLGQAEQMSKVGLPSEQYNLASTNIQRGTQAGLRQLSRMSNPFAGIAGLQRGQSDAFAQLDASNAAARRQNILQAMGARRELAGQKLSKQQYAQQGYFDKVNQANAMIGAGRQNVAGGLSTIGNVGASMAGSAGRQQPSSVIPPTTTATTNALSNTPAFNPSDPLGLGQFTNPYQGIGGVAGNKFGGYMGGGYYGKINPLTGLPY
jgi:hypothetical protein